MRRSQSRCRLTHPLWLAVLGTWAALLGVMGGCGGEESSTISERWDEIYMDGIKAGYSHTKATRAAREAGRDLWQVTSEAKLIVNREGKRAELSMRHTSVETPGGQLLRFESVNELGGAPMTLRGRVDGNQLHVERSMGSQTETLTLPWSADDRTPFAVQHALEQRPLAPGEERKLRQFDPHLLQTFDVQLKAAKHETTALLAGSAELLRISAAATAPAIGEMTWVIWTDRDGRIVKSWNADHHETSYSSSRFEAVKEPQGELYDIGLATRVPVDRPLSSPHSTKRVVYRVTLKGRDPAALFATGPTQTVQSIDNRTAKLIVRALAPDTPGIAAEPEPTEADLRPNSLIQSDDEQVRAMARHVAAEEKDPWKVALALERHVRDKVQPGTLAQALVSAAEVARSLQGDCTEHAVLLAALARARGIPSRAALGLVYVNGYFAFHMWTEVYIANRWIPVDATLGVGGIGAAHLKLSDTNFAAEQGLASFWRVAGVMLQIAKLEIVEVE